MKKIETHEKLMALLKDKGMAEYFDSALDLYDKNGDFGGIIFYNKNSNVRDDVMKLLYPKEEIQKAAEEMIKDRINLTELAVKLLPTAAGKNTAATVEERLDTALELAKLLIEKTK